MNKRLIAISLLIVAASPLALHGQAPAPATANAHVLDPILDQFQQAAGVWQTGIATAAMRLFYLLLAIDVIYTGITCALKDSGMLGFMAELVRRIIFVGFFLALLTYGHDWAVAIVNSFQSLGAQGVSAAAFGSPAGGVPITGDLRPSAVAEIGIQLAFKITDASPSGLLHLGGAIFFGWAALLVLIGFALIAVRQVMILAETYIVLSAGVILLGFGGSRWTKDYAINYLKYAVSVGIKLMFVQLTVALAISFTNNFITSAATLDLGRVASLIVALVVLGALVWSVPAMAGKLLEGASHADGSEALGAGKVAVAAGVAAAVGVASGGTALASAARLASAQGKAAGGLSSVAGAASGGRLANGMAQPAGAALGKSAGGAAAPAGGLAKGMGKPAGAAQEASASDGSAAATGGGPANASSSPAGVAEDRPGTGGGTGPGSGGEQNTNASGGSGAGGGAAATAGGQAGFARRVALNLARAAATAAKHKLGGTIPAGVSLTGQMTRIMDQERQKLTDQNGT